MRAVSSLAILTACLLAIFAAVSAATAGEHGTRAVTLGAAEFKPVQLSADVDDSARPRCIFCGSEICTNLDNLLGPALPDFALAPAGYDLVLPRLVALRPQSRAPPALVQPCSSTFDPRGPPLLI